MIRVLWFHFLRGRQTEKRGDNNRKLSVVAEFEIYS